MANLYVGIDVCKDFLDVHLHPLDLYQRFSNDKSGFKGFYEWLKGHTVKQVIVEASGTLHRKVCGYLHERGYSICIANPYRTRKFADSMGILAKTDKVDAKMLAQFGALLHPQSTAIPTEKEEHMQNLLTTRSQLVSQVSNPNYG